MEYYGPHIPAIQVFKLEETANSYVSGFVQKSHYIFNGGERENTEHKLFEFSALEFIGGAAAVTLLFWHKMTVLLLMKHGDRM